MGFSLSLPSLTDAPAFRCATQPFGPTIAMKSLSFLITVSLVASMAASVQGTMCYFCLGVNNDTCITDPSAVAIQMSCSSGMCNVLRTEIKTPDLGTTVTTFIQTCSTDLCNTGDGRSPGTINAAKSVTTTAAQVGTFTSLMYLITHLFSFGTQ